MKIKPTLEAYLIAHSQGGKWTGPHLDGVPVVTTHLGLVPVGPYLAQLGIELTKLNKYKVRHQNADMGEPQFGGDTPDIGNGISEIEE